MIWKTEEFSVAGKMWTMTQQMSHLSANRFRFVVWQLEKSGCRQQNEEINSQAGQRCNWVVRGIVARVRARNCMLEWWPWTELALACAADYSVSQKNAPTLKQYSSKW